jgi:hypothetical protein
MYKQKMKSVIVLTQAEYDDGTAPLMATVTNRFGRDTTINITFDDRQDTYAINKTAGGPVLD